MHVLVTVFSPEVCLIERVIKKPSEALPSPVFQVIAESYQNAKGFVL